MRPLPEGRRSYTLNLAGLPLAIVTLAATLIVGLLALLALLVATLVLAVASLFRPDLRRLILSLWRAARAARAYRRWQRGPTVEVVDVDPVDRG